MAVMIGEQKNLGWDYFVDEADSVKLVVVNDDLESDASNCGITYECN
jgi:hypothetical protein